MRDLIVFLDARCLQDPSFRSRGIGSHIASLLESTPSVSGPRLRLVAMVDRDLPPLPEPVRSCVDTVVPHANPVIPADGAVFVATSPMTHRPSRFMRLAGHQKVVSAAIVYDFIPYDLPGLLPTPDSALEYAACLQWLKAYDLFFAISRFSAARLRHHMLIPERRTFVTGCALRQGLREALADTEFTLGPAAGPGRYFLLFTGDNPRKNPEVAVRALDALGRQGYADVSLKVVGVQTTAAQKWLSETRKETQRRVEIVGDVSDGDLRRLYGHAVATIVPSLMEGFSLPVAESVACGTPVIASAIEVHRELIADETALFDAADPAALATRMAAALDDNTWRARMMEAQRSAAVNAAPERVWPRFWEPLLEACEARSAAARGRRSATPRRPSIALLTPFPPDQSGVASYSASTVSALAELCEVSVFTDAPRTQGPQEGQGRIAGRIDVGPFLHPGFDAVVLVVGNSHFHNRILDLCERYGGPTILHDARLTPIYAQRLGRPEFLRRVEAISGRNPPDGDIDEWLRAADPPPLFLEPIAYTADPLIVHTDPSRDLVKRLYGVEAALVPFATASRLADPFLSPAARDAARARVGVGPGTLLITTFGFPAVSKGTLECVKALRHLRDWKVNAELHTVGSDVYLDPRIVETVRELGLSPFVRMYRDFVPEDLYADYLRASDIAVQLRTYGFGQFSAALAECIGSGLACVASAELAEACDAPSNVVRVPMGADSIQIAEAIRTIRASPDAPTRADEERISFLERHSFRSYARRLMEVVGF